MFKSSATAWTRGFRVPRVLQSGGLLLCVLLAGCATQAPQPAAPPAVISQAPKHKPRHIITPAEILAAQPADVQQIIANHEQGRAWPTIRHGGTVLYAYNADTAPTVDCAPLRTTDIQLGAGETVTDVALGDGQRWMATPAAAGGSAGVATPHIVVKPELPGIATNLTVYTSSGRIYHLELRSSGREMREVEFYYPDDTLKAMAEAEQAAKQPATDHDETDSAQQSALPDVYQSHLNFAYKIDGAHVNWTPTRVFDDGNRVFLEMPARMQTGAAPALLVEASGGRQMVNYRVVPIADGGSYYVIDRLFDKAELISGVGRDQDRVLVTYSGGAR